MARKPISRTSKLRTELGAELLRPRLIHSTVVVTVAALRHQNCELDHGIALVLQRGVADPLHEHRQKIERIRKRVSSRKRY